MMQKVINLILICLLIGGNSWSQKIQKLKDYYVLPNADTIFSATYTIYNEGEDYLLLWFNSDEDTGLDKCKEYFNKRRGDFTLLEIMNDESVLNKRFDIIGQSFLKQIESKKKFVVSALYKSKRDWIDDPFEKKIIIVKEEKLPEQIREALSRNKSFLYNSQTIPIAFDELVKIH